MNARIDSGIGTGLTEPAKPATAPEALTVQDIVRAFAVRDWSDRKGQIMRAAVARATDQVADLMHEWAKYRHDDTRSREVIMSCVEARFLDAIQWAVDEYERGDDDDR